VTSPRKNQGKSTIPIAQNVGSAGVNFRARDIDTDHDGSISKEEFLADTGKKCDGMNKTNGCRRSTTWLRRSLAAVPAAQ
jgi:hypothetical protein